MIGHIGVVLLAEQYRAMRQNIDLDQRGYVFYLRDSGIVDNFQYDLGFDYVVVSSAKKMTEGPTRDLDKKIINLISEDEELFAMPFLKTTQLDFEDHYADFEAIHQRLKPTGNEINYFMLLRDSEGKIFQRKTIKGITAYDSDFVKVIDEVDLNEQKQVRNKRKTLVNFLNKF